MQHDDSRWHLKKEIQIGHIITTLTVAASIAVYVSKIEQRLAVAETQIIAQHERDERQDRASNEGINQVRQLLARMEDKLDRLIEGSRK